MKFTFSWLKEHLATDASIDAIVETMTMTGLEVEGVENAGERLAPFTVARVISAAKHPNADKLQVCQVETKLGNLEIVCGAPAKPFTVSGITAADTTVGCRKVRVPTKPCGSASHVGAFAAYTYFADPTLGPMSWARLPVRNVAAAAAATPPNAPLWAKSAADSRISAC